MAVVTLHATTYGENGSPIVFCHGLFGQGKNWTSIAKAFAGDHQVLLLDLPHHGRSPWSDEFDYLEMADQVADALPDEPVTLVGHSMGGKVAMVLALRHPERVERLCVVDVAPVDYGSAGEFGGYIKAMRGLDLDALESRSQASDALTEAVPSETVRGFLLQNLRREGDDWRWQPNLEVLGEELAEVTGWPAEDARRRGAVRRAGAVGRGRGLRLHHRRGHRRDGPVVPDQPAGDDQGRRPLGALAAARGVHRGAAPVPRLIVDR